MSIHTLEQDRQTLLVLGTAISGSGQERGCKVGLPYLSHHHHAQLQTARSSPMLAKSDSRVAKNLGITLKLMYWK